MKSLSQSRKRTEWCAEADRYRCMRCGRGSKYMKMPGRCNGPKFLSKSLTKWRRRFLGGHDSVGRMHRQGEVLIWCRKCSGYGRQRMGAKLVNCCRPEQMGTKEFGKMMKRIQTLEEGRAPEKSVDSTPIITAHPAQCSLCTTAERIARAWLKNCITSLCA